MFVHMYYCFFLPEEIFWEWNNVRKIMYDSVWVFLAVILYLNFFHIPARILHEPQSEKEVFIERFCKDTFFFGSRVVGEVLKYVCASTKPVWKRLDPQARGS